MLNLYVNLAILLAGTLEEISGSENAEAIYIRRKMMELKLHKSGSLNIEITSDLVRLYTRYQKAGLFKDAEDCRILIRKNWNEVTRSLKPSDSVAVANAVEHAFESTKEIIDFLENYLDDIKKDAGYDTIDVVAVFEVLAKKYIECQDFENALRYYSMAHELSQNKRGDVDISTAYYLAKMGALQAILGDWFLGNAALERSIRMIEKLGGKENYYYTIITADRDFIYNLLRETKFEITPEFLRLS